MILDEFRKLNAKVDYMCTEIKLLKIIVLGSKTPSTGFTDVALRDLVDVAIQDGNSQPIATLTPFADQDDKNNSDQALDLVNYTADATENASGHV